MFLRLLMVMRCIVLFSGLVRRHMLLRTLDLGISWSSDLLSSRLRPHISKLWHCASRWHGGDFCSFTALAGAACKTPARPWSSRSPREFMQFTRMQRAFTPERASWIILMLLASTAAGALARIRGVKHKLSQCLKLVQITYLVLRLRQVSWPYHALAINPHGVEPGSD